MKTKSIRVFFLSLVFCFLNQYAAAQNRQIKSQDSDIQAVDKNKLPAKQIEVTFISNCGFLLRAGNKKILFDIENTNKAFDKQALTRAYDLMLKNENPFNDINAILISHSHSDHLGTAELTNYLTNKDNVVLYSTIDTKGEFRKESGYNKIKERIISVDPYLSGIIDTAVSGINIEFLGMYHAGAPDYIFRDLCFILEIDSMRIFYMSDIDPGYEKNLDVIQKWSKKNKKIDLLFTPDINLYPNKWSKRGYEIIKEYIKPEKIIAMHLDPKQISEAEKNIKACFPKAIIFKNFMDKMIFSL